MAELAGWLSNSPAPPERIAALNFLAFERRAALDYPAALQFYEDAVDVAKEIGDEYLIAISIANRAILNIGFEVYQLGLKELESVQAALDCRKEHNARFASSLVRSWIVAGRLGMGDTDRKSTRLHSSQ